MRASQEPRRLSRALRRSTIALLLSTLPALAGCGPSSAPADTHSATPESAPEEQPAETFGIRNAAPVEDGLMAAGQPTAEQLEAAAAAGYRTVIDLRRPEEDRGFDEATVTTAAGMSYVNLPVSGDAIGPELVDLFDATLRDAERPVLLHCGSSNRVAAVYASLLIKDGESLEEALERARQIGLTSAQLEERVRLVATELGEGGESAQP